jgi:hypothetical protein
LRSKGELLSKRWQEPADRRDSDRIDVTDSLRDGLFRRHCTPFADTRG